jgi:putative phage-type endonuclease
MKRAIHNFVQGSPEWHAYRATPNQFNASDAPAMLGESPYKSRDQILKDLATGSSQEVTAMVQRKFDDGHRFEEEDRPRAEEFIGQELYPATVSVDLGSMKLSSSLDGWTMCEAIIYEHKTKNKLILEFAARNEIPLLYRIQMEQQLLCSGADKCLFSASNGAADDEPVRIWYFPDMELRSRLVAGWAQIAIDLANYVVPEAEAPKAIAEPVAALPAIKYEIDFSKGLSINSNLDAFKVAAQELVEKSKAILVSDQDFENAKARIRECEKAEANIKSLIDRVLGELGDVNTFKSDLESIGGWIRQSRLNQDKQVKSRTVERKAEIINAGKAAVLAHTNEINAKLARASLPSIPVDFDAAVFRKSSFDSMQSAVNDAVADFKIKASRWETQILINLMAIDAIAKDYMFLFSDLQQLVHKDAEAMEAIAKQRIADHKVQEDARIQAEAKRIADEQIERDRQAEAQRVADLAKQNEVVAPAVQAPAVQSEPVATASTANARQSFGGGSYGGSHIDRSSAAQSPVQAVQPQVTTEQCPAHEVQLNDYQRGIIAGLELALRIHANCLRSNADFISAINAVCTSDNIPAAPISKAA